MLGPTIAVPEPFQEQVAAPDGAAQVRRWPQAGAARYLKASALAMAHP